MPTNERDNRAAGRQPEQGSGRTAHRRQRTPFQKDHATLWLLTVALGLGLGAGVRFVERAVQARTAAVTPSFAATQAQRSTASPYQSQRVAVLPGQVYSPRATSRMS